MHTQQTYRVIPVLYSGVLVLFFPGCKEPTVAQNDEYHATKEVNKLDPRTSNDEVPRETVVFNVDKEWARLTGMAMQDYGRAAAWVRANVAESNQETTLMKLAVAIGEADLAHVDKALQSIRANDLRASACTEILRFWSKQDPNQLVDYAEKHLSGEFKNEAFQGGIRGMIDRTDYEGARNALAKMPYSSRRTFAIEDLANAWGVNDPTEALRWAGHFDMSEDKASAMRSVIMSFTNAGNADALGGVIQNEANLDFVKMAVFNLAQLTTQRSGAAVANEWVGRLPENLRPSALSGIIQKQAITDTEGATNAALGLSDVRLKQGMLSNILSAKVKETPKQAAAWVLNLPNDDLKMRMVPQLVGSWYGTNSMELSDWVNTLPKGDIRDEALNALARSLVTSDREAAMEVARAISNSAKRDMFLGDYHFSPSAKETGK